MTIKTINASVDSSKIATTHRSFSEKDIADATNAKVLLGRMEAVPFSRWHTKVRLIMGTATFFDAVDALSLAFVLPVLIKLWSMSPAQVGILIGMGYIGQLFGALFFGWLAERKGRVISATLAVGTMSVMGIACIFTGSFHGLLICRFIQGIGVGGEVPVAATYINELSRAKGRGRFFMLYELIFPLGLMATGIIGARLIPSLGWEAMFLTGAIPGLIIVFFVARLPESPRWLISKGRFDEAERIIETIEASTAEREAAAPVAEKPLVPVIQQKGRLRELLSPFYRRRTLIVWLLWATSYFVANGINNWAPTLYTTIYNLPLQDALHAASYNTMFQVVATIMCAFLVDRIGRKGWAICAYLLVALSLGTLGILNNPGVGLVIMLIVFGYGLTGATNTLLYLYTPEIYPTRIRAIATSVATAWLRLASAIAPAIVGFFVGTKGIGFLFIMFAVVSLVGALAARYMIETRERRLEDIAP